MKKIKISESQMKRIIAESVKKILKEAIIEQKYTFDLSQNSLINQKTISKLHSALNMHKPTECELNMFYGNGFTCDATFKSNGNSICTVNIVSSTQYNKTFDYNTGNAVQQTVDIAKELCYQWLQEFQQNRQQK